MSQEPTETPQPRGLRGPAARGTARGRAGLGGRPRLEAPTSRHLALPGTDTNIPAPPSSMTIPNSGDADDLPAPLSLTTIPGSGRADDSESRLDEALPAPNAVGSCGLATVNSPRPPAPPAPSGDAGTRSSGTPDTLAVGTNTARAVEQSTALSASLGNADTNLVSALTTRSTGRSVAATHSGAEETALTTQRTPNPSATQISSLKFYPTVAASLGTLQDSTRETALVARSRHSAAQVRQYVAAQVHRWMSREPGIVQPPDPYYPDRHHWPMRTWLLEKKETCLCLPVVTDPVVLQVDLEELRFSGGARDFTSVIATLQTMLHDAGYAFLNLVPTWGRTLSLELLASQVGQFMSDASFLWGLLTVEQVAWNEIAQGRQYSVRRDDAPFQTLDPEVTSAFRLEDDGDTLMLTPEEQELLGVAMVTRLRLAHNRSDAAGVLMRRCPCLHGPGTRVWGGIPEVVGTSSLASGDAPMLTPDENMSSAGGGSPGLEPSTAMVGVYMTTTGTTAGQSYTTEQPTLYVPVAEYPPGQDTRPPPPASPSTAPPVRSDGLGGSEEETKSGVPMTIRGPHLPENSRDWDRDLQEADRQISELRAALAARDELERIRNEEYRVARTAQAAQAKLPQEAWEHREAELQERVAQEMERRKVSDQDFESLQAKVYLLEKERAQEREEGTQFRAEADRRMEEVTEKCGQAVCKATAAID
ncbi:hypothetical protein PHMEG_00029401 [Phytophthora megakarya]|uniref:Uncharacterized protein n=1 Tax=Phytophthora megakarya TaxID=4795 RepID=A0A225V166_9STRA|nr:hypothetical protein PHMEG_00029401 [Phytophthora megakarya]